MDLAVWCDHVQLGEWMRAAASSNVCQRILTCCHAQRSRCSLHRHVIVWPDEHLFDEMQYVTQCAATTRRSGVKKVSGRRTVGTSDSHKRVVACACMWVQHSMFLYCLTCCDDILVLLLPDTKQPQRLGHCANKTHNDWAVCTTREG